MLWGTCQGMELLNPIGTLTCGGTAKLIHKGHTFLHSYRPSARIPVSPHLKNTSYFPFILFYYPRLGCERPAHGGFSHTSPCAQLLNGVQLFATPQTVARQAPPSTEFSRQESWSVLPFSTPGDFPDPGIEPESPESPTLAGRFLTTEPSGKPMHLPND